MTSSELRSEIYKIIDQLPESALTYVLEVVKRLQAESLKQELTEKLVKKILEEDHELFQRLAQYDSNR